MVAESSIPAYAGEPDGTLNMVPACRVYPRVCGGTGYIQRILRKRGRLSPRMRGNRVGTCLPPGRDTSIPAYAGEPSPGFGKPSSSDVYPRVCGGTDCNLTASSPAGGLSPRMRGNRAGISGSPGNGRSIPAYAGEPEASTPAAALCKVYPRVCGGTLPAPSGLKRVSRLSPRMRGNLCWRSERGARLRSIPAYAGEPRNHYGNAVALVRLSPRMRGNPISSSRQPDPAPSIPAYAGEPLVSPARRNRGRVYPRVCGGTERVIPNPRAISRLSPRMRGNPVCAAASGMPWGSIPAYAGEPG